MKRVEFDDAMHTLVNKHYRLDLRVEFVSPTRVQSGMSCLALSRG